MSDETKRCDKCGFRADGDGSQKCEYPQCPVPTYRATPDPRERGEVVPSFWAVLRDDNEMMATGKTHDEAVCEFMRFLGGDYANAVKEGYRCVAIFTNWPAHPAPAREVREDEHDEWMRAMVREVEHYRALLAEAFVIVWRAVEAEEGLDGSEADAFHGKVRALWPAVVDHPTVVAYRALPEDGSAPPDAEGGR